MMPENESVRLAEKKDAGGFYRLWKLCFADSDSFCNWLFENRFYPQYSVCIEKDGEILSAMQGVPYTIGVRGKSLRGMMLCGVSTHPEHRKKGYMRKIFIMEMNLLHEKGFAVAVHTPAVLQSYFAYGHYPVADAVYVQGELQGADGLNESFYEKAQWLELYPLYEKNIANKYSGAIQRTKEEFLRKGEDYAADGGRLIVLKEGEVKGYAFVYTLGDQVMCPEAVAEEGYYEALVQQIIAYGNGKKSIVKLPFDVQLTQSYEKTIRIQKGVAGACNMSAILKGLEINCPYAVEIFDPIVAGNNGVFRFDGEKTTETPAIKVEAGRFLGVLMGYYSLEEIQPFVTILNQEGYTFINGILPRCKCYIIDEY